MRFGRPSVPIPEGFPGIIAESVPGWRREHIRMSFSTSLFVDPLEPFHCAILTNPFAKGKERSFERKTLYIDKQSGKDFQRPQYQRMLQRLKKDDLPLEPFHCAILTNPFAKGKERSFETAKDQVQYFCPRSFPFIIVFSIFLRLLYFCTWRHRPKN